jgi:glycosyltransferase involved in cell wall biosynthesis
MHVLHVLPYVRDVGDGIVNATVDLACEQRRMGIDVTIASAGGEFEELLAEEGVEHRQLNITRDPMRVLGEFHSLSRLLKSLRPDIAHSHTLTATVTVRASRLIDRPPLVHTAHTEFYRSTPLIAVADRVIAPSQAVVKALRRRGIPRRKVRLVKNGTLGAPRMIRGRTNEAAHLCHPNVITVATMRTHKGISDLIYAFARSSEQAPTAHLYLVGDGPDRAKFEAQASSTGCMDRIHFVGYRTDVWAYLRAADIFVLASHHDASPLVIAEAREAECAIIASDADGIPERLDDGRAGLLFSRGDKDALARELTHLLVNEKSRSDWRRAASQNLDWLKADRVAHDTVDVYHELLSKR